MNHLDPRVSHLWRLQALVRFFLLWLPVTGGGALFLSARFGSLTFVPAGVLLGSYLLLSLLWPSLSWARYRYGVREHDLVVERGVLFRQTVSVPLARIQHVDTHQGPIERALGLSSVFVYTAAGLTVDATVPGLEEATAGELRDQLSRRGGDDGV